MNGKHTPEKKTVILVGELGRKFGRQHHLCIKNPAEAVRAICANRPGFDQHLRQSADRNVVYRVIVGKEVLPDASHLQHPSGRQTIKIVPVIVGAGAVLRVITGVALLAAAFFTGGITLFAGLTLSGTLGAIGASLLLGGVSQLLSGQEKTDGPPADEKPSSTFNGPVNTVSQGHPVPIGYGRMIVGSQVISASLEIGRIA